MSIPAVARSKAWVCGYSFAGITSSNPAGVMDVCLLWVLFVLRSLCVGLILRPEESYRMCVCVGGWVCVRARVCVCMSLSVNRHNNNLCTSSE